MRQLGAGDFAKAQGVPDKPLTSQENARGRLRGISLDAESINERLRALVSKAEGAPLGDFRSLDAIISGLSTALDLIAGHVSALETLI